MSMTGYAQSEGQIDALSWRLELKSVNSKGFDLRCRIPGGFDAFEANARALLTQRLKRGAISLNLQIEAKGGLRGARLNRPLLEDVLKAARELGSSDLRLEHLLAVRGVIETDEASLEPTPALLAALDAALPATLDKLASSRQSEGDHLKAILLQHLDHIESLTYAARDEAANAPGTLRERLQQQLADLLGQTGLPEERLAQEVALLASKVDVAEEINRLLGHVKAIRAPFAEGGPVGRKLDFLCQELNREANTLCSKSTTLALTNIGVDLKVVIEQFREQVQNAE